MIDNIRTKFKRKRLKSLCRIPWVKRQTVVETFAEFFPVIVKSLRGIVLKEDTVQWNRETVADTNGLLSAVEKVSFLVSLVIGYIVLNSVKGLTAMFLESSIDITRAMGLEEDTRKSFQGVRHRGGDWGVPRRMDETGTRNSGKSWNQYSHGPAHVSQGKHQSCYI